MTDLYFLVTQGYIINQLATEFRNAVDYDTYLACVQSAIASTVAGSPSMAEYFPGVRDV